MEYSGANILARDFGLHWAITPRDINCIHLCRSCYIDPLKCGAWTRPVDNGVMMAEAVSVHPTREGPASDMYVGMYL